MTTCNLDVVQVMRCCARNECEHCPADESITLCTSAHQMAADALVILQAAQLSLQSRIRKANGAEKALLKEILSLLTTPVSREVTTHES